MFSFLWGINTKQRSWPEACCPLYRLQETLPKEHKTLPQDRIWFQASYDFRCPFLVNPVLYLLKFNSTLPKHTFPWISEEDPVAMCFPPFQIFCCLYSFRGGPITSLNLWTSFYIFTSIQAKSWVWRKPRLLKVNPNPSLASVWYI